MKRVVRSDCFETNSSSQHCLIFTKSYNKQHVDDIREQDLEYLKKHDYMIEINTEDKSCNYRDLDTDFGWGLTFLVSPIEKAVYALAANYAEPDDDFYEEVMEILSEYYGHEVSIHPVDHSYEPVDRFGDVDHQSHGYLWDVNHDYELLKEYLTDPNYVMVIDNDNSMYLRTMVRDGIIDKDSFKFVFEEDKWYED